MSIFKGVETYYGLFGLRGLMLAAKARLLHGSVETTVVVPGIQHPMHVRLRTTDVSVFRQVLVIREYECPFSRSPNTIVDAGANIGLTSVFYANKYPDARIVAIEPESSNFQILKKNTEPYRNITAVQAALWSSNVDLCLIDPHVGHDGFRTGEAPRPGFTRERYVPVRGVTLDRLIAELNLDRIDILKVDIEGSEKEVFENSTTWIDRVDTIIIEFHDQFRAGCARSVYSAAKEFELEWRRGETVFLARKDCTV